jgi:hypothetical protein
VHVAETQNGTGEQAGHEVCDAERNLPASHAVHCELAAVVQVSAEVHPLTAVHAVQTSGCPGPPVCRKYPGWHWVHRESWFVVHVSFVAQCATSEQNAHVSAPAGRADVSR